MEQKTTINIKEIENIKWSIVERILLAFYENGSLKKSQIALKSGLKYNACMRYLNWLNEKMEFIVFEFNNDHTQIKSAQLTPQGISFCKNKIFEKENIVVKNNAANYLLKNITY